MKCMGHFSTRGGSKKPPRLLTVLDFLLKLPLFIRLPSAADRERRGQNNAVRHTLVPTSWRSTKRSLTTQWLGALASNATKQLCVRVL